MTLRTCLIMMTALAVITDNLIIPFYPQYFAERFDNPPEQHVGLYLAVPVLASVGTGPVIAYHFGRLSLAGFVANPILVPLVGFVVVPLGFLIAFLSLVAEILATPLIWLASPFLSLVLWLVRFFANLPMATISVPTPNVLEVALGYFLIISLLLLARPRYSFLPLAFALEPGPAADEAVAAHRPSGSRSTRGRCASASVSRSVRLPHEVSVSSPSAMMLAPSWRMKKFLRSSGSPWRARMR